MTRPRAWPLSSRSRPIERLVEIPVERLIERLIERQVERPEKSLFTCLTHTRRNAHTLWSMREALPSYFLSCTRTRRNAHTLWSMREALPSYFLSCTRTRRSPLVSNLRPTDYRICRVKSSVKSRAKGTDDRYWIFMHTRRSPTCLRMSQPARRPTSRPARTAACRPPSFPQASFRFPPSSSPSGRAPARWPRGRPPSRSSCASPRPCPRAPGAAGGPR